MWCCQWLFLPAWSRTKPCDNQTYKVVWQVLQALRSHDDSFDAMVNKLDLIGSDPRKMEVIAITDKADKKAKKSGETSKGKAGKGQYGIGEKAQQIRCRRPANPAGRADLRSG